MNQKKRIHVVAGILRDAHGRVLLAQRGAGKHLAGLWEFPGGKVEADEAPLAALRRELHEEVGVDVDRAEHLVTVPWTYPEKHVDLEVWDVGACGATRKFARKSACKVPFVKEKAACWTNGVGIARWLCYQPGAYKVCSLGSPASCRPSAR